MKTELQAILGTMIVTLSLAPIAHAEGGNDPVIVYCPTPDPEAWTTLCVKAYPQETLHAWAYTAEPEGWYGASVAIPKVCPINNICVGPLTLVYFFGKYTTTYRLDYSATVNWDNLPIECPIVTCAGTLAPTAPQPGWSVAYGDSDLDLVPDGLLFNDGNGNVYFVGSENLVP